MKKTYSKKERQTRKLLRNISIFILIAITLISITLPLISPNLGNSPYSAQELAHDHDGDGIPDH